MAQFNDGLEAIQTGIATAGSSFAKPQTLTEDTVAQLERIIAGLRAVPVNVDINVVPVQDDDHTIEGMEKSEKSPGVRIEPQRHD